MVSSEGYGWLDVAVSATTVNAVARMVGAIVAANAKKGARYLNYEAISALVRNSIRTLTDPDVRRKLQNLNILWVHRDDKDDQYERQVFETLGAKVRFCYSTKEVLKLVFDGGHDSKSAPYNVVISNMLRPEEHDLSAGLTLCKELRQRKERIPFFIYSRSIDDDQVKAKIREFDFPIRITSDPEDLFQFIFDELKDPEFLPQ